ncbi:hypothetical protein BDR03DRAFT_968442 [Suillus americanus]|nr:hypothetical protein BDR03DRAFT_968442 [Suillus americanus]
MDLTTMCLYFACNRFTTPPPISSPLHLLSTHCILRETAQCTFALTRFPSMLDSRKNVANIFAKLQPFIAPRTRYEDSSGIAAFVDLCASKAVQISCKPHEGVHRCSVISREYYRSASSG